MEKGVKKMIKLIALDLDGTLLNSKKEISQFNQEVLNKARALGIKIVLCTGRPIMGIQSFLEELNLLTENDYCITFNGGLVQKTKSGEIVASKVHSFADVHYIYNELFKVNLPVNMIDTTFVYEPTYPKGAPTYYSTLNAKLPYTSKEVNSFAKNHLFNKVVCCFGDVKILEKRMSQLPQEMYERFSIFKSQPVLFEIMPKGVNKGFGMKQLCQLLNISSDEVMAFGDEANDIEMIKFAKYGIAMANAVDELKKEAYAIAETNDNDGVGKTILKFL